MSLRTLDSSTSFDFWSRTVSRLILVCNTVHIFSKWQKNAIPFKRISFEYQSSCYCTTVLLFIKGRVKLWPNLNDQTVIINIDTREPSLLLLYLITIIIKQQQNTYPSAVTTYQQTLHVHKRLIYGCGHR